jgi:site-specific DNA recombinase
MLEPTINNALERQSLITTASKLAAKWPRLGASAKRIILNQLVTRIDIKPDSIELQIRPHQLPNILRGNDESQTNQLFADFHTVTDALADINAATTGNVTGNNPAAKDSESETITVSLPAKLKRAGLETKLVIDANISGSDKALSLKAPDPYLHKLIAKAHEFQAIFLRGGQTITAMAEEAGVSGSYFTRTLRYSFLSPDITKAIIAGRQPVQLTTRKLLSYPSMPTCWNAQKCMMEFI